MSESPPAALAHNLPGREQVRELRSPLPLSPTFGKMPGPPMPLPLAHRSALAMRWQRVIVGLTTAELPCDTALFEVQILDLPLCARFS